MKLFLRLLATAVATAIAVWLLPGITLTADTTVNQALTLLGVAVILGVVNAVVRPFAAVLGTCLIVLTFGLFLLVINALMLMLTSWVAGQVGLGFHVDGFWTALIGSFIISVVSAVVSSALGANDSTKRRM
ncbi:phage holin family protein [Tessaracoccus sp. Z1128]